MRRLSDYSQEELRAIAARFEARRLQADENDAYLLVETWAEEGQGKVAPAPHGEPLGKSREGDTPYVSPIKRLVVLDEEVELRYAKAAGLTRRPPDVVTIPAGPHHERIDIRFKHVALAGNRPASVRISPRDKHISIALRVFCNGILIFSHEDVTAAAPAFIPEIMYDEADRIDILRIAKM